MNYKKEGGRRLQEARKLRAMTLNEVAAIIDGMSASRISNYEQGIRSMGPADATALGAALEVSAAYLLCLDDEAAFTSEEIALIDNYRNSDERGQKMIRGVAQTQSEFTIKQSNE